MIVPRVDPNTTGGSYCQKCKQWVPATTFHYCHTEPPQPATNYGWVCPRCQAVHAPHVSRCNCRPPGVTVASDKIVIGGGA